VARRLPGLRPDLRPLHVFQFLELIDGDGGAPLNVVWIFAVVGAMGAVAALIAGVRFGMLAAGIAWSIAWFALWDELLGDDFSDAGTIRGLSSFSARSSSSCSAVARASAARPTWARWG